ncbi:MAG: hypothetical protein JJ934_07475 [Pseudomonadales bacterium]|nr:hypothetical protein [Pseudomonadales bacterium]MBO6594538.1 hypothetical protein [Pseudomonadales bacterium]MBO6656716.1 hypothetical protein [Pseudomonadales bacterium]MBO6701041.1 hypothetical protein [Pseudomonadales bacterium]MBO6821901.1 hypothetical protein [Pseudomonadales bacterium]
MKYWFSLFLCLCVSGCATTTVVTANSTPARQATTPIAFDELMDIGILPIDPNIPADLEEIEKKLIVPDVRRAESSYIAYHLKDTLELTGNWGAVRVTPESAKSVDVELQGRIVMSDGEQIKVQMRAVDARGRVWFDRTYEDTASKFSYEKPREDPFQDLYNDIANDLLTAQEQMGRQDILAIKTVANLKYARDLAPEAFDGYLQENNRGQVKVIQLPAETDSMLLRVNRIKEQEYLFVDTLDDYYSRFYRDMRPSYDEWRHATYDEAIRLREIQRQARARLATGALLIAGGIYAGSESNTWAGDAAAAGAVVGGIGAVRAGLERRKEAEIHAASLKELSQSLGTEITPYVLDIEGRTIELTGTAEEQYQQWRELLSEIYAQETSLPVQ